MSVGDKRQIREQANLDEVQESALFYRVGMQYLLQNPLQDIKNSFKKIQYLYTTTKKPWPWSQEGRELRFAGGMWLPVWAWSWPAMIAIAGGLYVTLQKRCRVGILLWSIIGQTVSCVIFHADARFRLPLIPIFAFFLAQGIVWGLEQTSALPQRIRLLKAER